MDYKTKLKKRLYVAIAEAAIGIAMIAASFFSPIEMLSAFGLAFTVVGLTRIRQYIRIMNNDEFMRKRETEETDERNIKIWTQARSWAFYYYIILAGISIILLYTLGYDLYGEIVSYNVMSLMVIYWICYVVARRKY